VQHVSPVIPAELLVTGAGAGWLAGDRRISGRYAAGTFPRRWVSWIWLPDGLPEDRLVRGRLSRRLARSATYCASLSMFGVGDG